MSEEKRTTLWDLHKLAKEVMTENITYNPKVWLTDSDIWDMMAEVADGIVPTYTYDSLTVAESDLWLACTSIADTEIIGEAHGGLSALDIINANIYQAIYEQLAEDFEEYRRIAHEIRKNAEENEDAEENEQ